jgi:voltage-dependent calcium channel T type alpha-1G
MLKEESVNSVEIGVLNIYPFKDRKNSWQSCEELRKYKDNYSREKRNQHVWKHHPLDEPKCNIQKESKMMGSSAGTQPPIITHTAATPQDSPNTTLDTGYRDINFRAIYPTTLSIESIDRSSVSLPILVRFRALCTPLA